MLIKIQVRMIEEPEVGWKNDKRNPKGEAGY